MSEIADLTYNVVAFSEIMQVMTCRLFFPVARLESLTLPWWGTWSTTELLPEAIFSDLRILTISIRANGHNDETFHWSLLFLAETPLSQKCSGCNYYRKKFCEYCPELWFLYKIWNYRSKLAEQISQSISTNRALSPTRWCFIATNFLEREEGTSL